MKLAASFWEEHCTECAMPECYAKCQMFKRAWHGRCKRVDFFAESCTGEGEISFRRWGKIEMVWREKVISKSAAKLFFYLNCLLRPLWTLLGFRHRAIRWRLMTFAGAKASFEGWRIKAKSHKDEHLTARITSSFGQEIFVAPIHLVAGVEQEFFFAPSFVPSGALFSIFPTDGEPTGLIKFYENVVIGGKRKSIKCLVWDLDGTLWDGILSEDGILGCKPKMESVKLLKYLDTIGVINSIASRNDRALAIEALEKFGLEQYFVFPEISWQEKSKALKKISSNINIPFDRIAFVDDRPEQRAEVELNAPGVRVFSESQIPSLSAMFPEAVSKEGASRRMSYRAEMKRRQVLEDKFLGDIEAFCQDSELDVQLIEYSEDYQERAFELLNRTNLLNISSRRYTNEGFAKLLDGTKQYVVKVKDKYGDYGTVGFVVMKKRSVIEMCFSCRIAGKGVEAQVLEVLSGGQKDLQADIVETDRNKFLVGLLKTYMVPIKEVVE